LINFDTQTDAVMITTETYTAKRAYQIASRFRSKNVPVLLGGYHPTLLPEEAANYADAVIIGNAEPLWASILQDVKEKRIQKVYYGEPSPAIRLPDRSIYRGKKYLPIRLIETGRGCGHSCEFCAITAYYKSRYVQRSIEDIVSDVRGSHRKLFFFIDDNIAADPGFLMRLCEALRGLGIRWSGQAALTVARNQKLLKALKKSGCDLLLIGFESLEADNVRQMGKTWSLRLGDQAELIKRIHGAGISIYATLLFGFDYDTQDTFKKSVEFCIKNRFFFAAFNHLLPLPGTKLYQRLLRENRLLSQNWWLEPGYRYGDVVFIPKNMTPEELSDRCAAARREFFAWKSIIKRAASLMKVEFAPSILYFFLRSNMNLREEVDGKLGLPVGEGLDTLPK